jgi:hypothetical protein
MADAARRAGVSPYVPIAVRAFTELVPPTTRRPSPPPPPWPDRVLVFDTETTTDATQRLTFGSYRYCRTGPAGTLVCVEEGLFHAPDLETNEFALLREYTDTHAADVRGEVDRTLHLRTLDEFLERVLWRVAYQHPNAVVPPAVVVGFNLPFDLSRLASAAGEARGPRGARGKARGGAFAGGFSFDLYGYTNEHGQREPNRFRPRVAIKTIDSKRHLIAFVPPAEIDEPDVFDSKFRGHFLDLRTLAFALTDRGYSLKSACAAFGVEHGKTEAEQHGVIDTAYIDYNRRDVQATTELYDKVLAEYRRHPIDLQPSKAYSPASIGKAYLRAMGIRPRLARQPTFPREILGNAMAAYYGGRAECRIRRTPVPVVYVDFLSMYPTVNSLMGLWDHVTAERIDLQDATEETRELLATIKPDRCFDPEIWRRFVGLVQLQPDQDVLPVRAKYAHAPNPTWQIGVNPLTSEAPLWYTIADVVAATLLGGKAPQVIKAVRFLPSQPADGMCPVSIRGTVTIDPRREDFFRAVIEQRKTLDRRTELADHERARLERFLKVLANSASYGIYAEMVRHETGTQRKDPVAVYSNGAAFQTDVTAPEEPGEYCFPPLAACITGAARLMLALLERTVTDAGGTYAFCDTDSMAIVATHQGGPVACKGGQEELDAAPAIRALSWQQVDDIRALFEALKPYDPDAVAGSVLELESENLDTHGHQRQLHCLAISAKRYALYTLNQPDTPELVKWSEHGLGHLLNPTDPDNPDRDWIRQLWTNEVHHALDLPTTAPEWIDRPALGRINVSKPHTLRAFARRNQGRPYSDQVKPFNFVLTAHTAQFGVPSSADPTRFQLIAPWESDPRRWHGLDWTNRDEPTASYLVSTSSGGDATAQIHSYRKALDEYRTHPESKSLGPAGERSGWHTSGLLGRRPISAARISYVGKEANDLETLEARLGPAGQAKPAEYGRHDDDWHIVRRSLTLIPAAVISKQTGLDRTMVWRYIQGRSVPRPRRMKQLADLAVAHASRELRNSGLATPTDAIASLEVWLASRRTTA